MSNNIFPVVMRDTRDDWRTGWTRNGLWEREYAAPASGVMGLGALGEEGERNLRRIPRAGRKHILRALNDRDLRVREKARKALLSSNPGEALASQAEQDVVETLRPTGAPVVFKDLAFEAAKQTRIVEDALVRAAPGAPTYEGAVAGQIVSAANTGVISESEANEALKELYEIVAMSAVTGVSTESILENEGLPEEMLGNIGLGDLGKRRKPFFKKIGGAIKKTVKKYGKPLLIGAAIVGVAMIPGVLPALGAAASFVGKGIASGASAIFGGGKTQQQVAYAEQATTYEQQAAALDASGQQAAAQQLRAQAEAMRYASENPEAAQPVPPPSYAPQPTYGPSYVPAPRAAAPAVPSTGVLDTIANAALSVYAIKRMASASKAPSDVQNYNQQRETLVREIMTTTNVSRQEAEKLADQAIQQIEGEKGAAPVPGEAARAGMDTGMMLPILAVGAVLVLSMAKGGGGGGGKRR